MIYQEFSDDDLERSLILVDEHYPHIAARVKEANSLLPTPHYHLSAWVNGQSVYVQLLYGDRSTGTLDLQVLDMSLSQIECTLIGFIHGFNVGTGSESGAYEMWQNFITHLNKHDVPNAKNFIGSIERYRKIFMEANK